MIEPARPGFLPHLRADGERAETSPLADIGGLHAGAVDGWIVKKSQFADRPHRAVADDRDRGRGRRVVVRRTVRIVRVEELGRLRDVIGGRAQRIVRDDPAGRSATTATVRFPTKPGCGGRIGTGCSGVPAPGNGTGGATAFRIRGKDFRERSGITAVERILSMCVG